VFDFEKPSFVRRGSRCLPLLGSYFESEGRSSSPHGENPGRACKEQSSGSPRQPSPVSVKDAACHIEPLMEESFQDKVAPLEADLAAAHEELRALGATPAPAPQQLGHLQESLAEGHSLPPPLLPIPGPVFSPVRSLGRTRPVVGLAMRLQPLVQPCRPSGSDVACGDAAG
jgi:hypothetical protein